MLKNKIAVLAILVAPIMLIAQVKDCSMFTWGDSSDIVYQKLSMSGKVQLLKQEAEHLLFAGYSNGLPAWSHYYFKDNGIIGCLLDVQTRYNKRDNITSNIIDTQIANYYLPTIYYLTHEPLQETENSVGSYKLYKNDTTIIIFLTKYRESNGYLHVWYILWKRDKVSIIKLESLLQKNDVKYDAEKLE